MTPVLLDFDPGYSIRLQIDLSGLAIAGIISHISDRHQGPAAELSATSGGKLSLHDWLPIVFWSRSMIPTERDYTTSD